jgi:hypothetical protein
MTESHRDADVFRRPLAYTAEEWLATFALSNPAIEGDWRTLDALLASGLDGERCANYSASTSSVRSHALITSSSESIPSSNHGKKWMIVKISQVSQHKHGVL